MNAKRLTRIALGAALMALLSQLALPLGGVPLTLQVGGCALLGGYLGKKDAPLAVGVWLLLGAAGAPVFFGFQGGLAHLLGYTGGFLWSFLPLAFLCGCPLPWCFLGVAVCHLLGTVQFSLVSQNTLWQSFLLGSLPYLAKDLLLAPLGARLGKRLKGIR